MALSKKTIIGTDALVKIEGVSGLVPAKVDTGADGTAIWASNISVTDGVLRFTFFDKKSPLYSGKVEEFTDFKVVKVTGSTGKSEMRFSVDIPVVIGGKRIRARCSLSDRSERSYPMLIGRRTLLNKFLVDVSRAESGLRKKRARVGGYTSELKKNPQAFLEKYKHKMIK